MSTHLEPPRGTRQFDIRIDAANGVRRAFVTANGEIDLASAPDFRAALAAAGAQGAAVTVDLSAVDFMDSSGVHALLEAQNMTMAAGGSLVVEGRSAPVARVLDLLGLSEVFAGPAEN
jgi:anti-sigma B factor antagonist